MATLLRRLDTLYANNGGVLTIAANYFTHDCIPPIVAHAKDSLKVSMDLENLKNIYIHIHALSSVGQGYRYRGPASPPEPSRSGSSRCYLRLPTRPHLRTIASRFER